MSGKGEVDHVGGIVKTIFLRGIAVGEFFFNGHAISFLEVKISDNDNPHYVIK